MSNCGMTRQLWKRYFELTVLTSALLLAACQSEPTREPSILGFYDEPAKEADDSATINGSLVEGSLGALLTPAVRARVVSIDRYRLPTGPRKPSPFAIREGSRLISAICEPEIDTGITYGNLILDVQRKRRYVIHCEAENPLINTGERFWIEDLDAGGKTVAEGRGWGPGHGPAGRRF